MGEEERRREEKEEIRRGGENKRRDGTTTTTITPKNKSECVETTKQRPTQPTNVLSSGKNCPEQMLKHIQC